MGGEIIIWFIEADLFDLQTKLNNSPPVHLSLNKARQEHIYVTLKLPGLGKVQG
jgi:hypothetical protein